MEGAEDYVVFDLETTGFRGMPLFSPYHRVLQIAAMRVSTGETFAAFVDAGFEEVPAASTRIHGIAAEDLRGAEGIARVWERLQAALSMTEKTVLVAHNADGFDAPVLRKEVGAVKYRFFDTLPFLRRACPGLKSYALGAVFAHFNGGAPLDGAHRADADVQALAAVFRRAVLPIINAAPPEVTLRSIRYVGPYRERLLREAGICAPGAWEGKGCADAFVRGHLKVEDPTQRAFIVAGLTGRRPEEVASRSLTPVDYYVATRYGGWRGGGGRFSCAYLRGLHFK